MKPPEEAPPAAPKSDNADKKKAWENKLRSAVVLSSIFLFGLMLVFVMVVIQSRMSRDEIKQNTDRERLEAQLKDLRMSTVDDEAEPSDASMPSGFFEIFKGWKSSTNQAPPAPMLFVSYNTADYQEVQALVSKLPKSVVCWLDSNELRPGDKVLSKLEEAVCKCNTMAILVGKHGIGTWQKDEIQMATCLCSHDPTRRVIPILLPDAKDETVLPGYLRIRRFIDMRGESPEIASQELVWGITGIQPGGSKHP